MQSIITIHDGKELFSLINKRKASIKIHETIQEQKIKRTENKRAKCTKEEYLTRKLLEMKCLLTETELVIYDQYPLSKYPKKQEGGKRADILYAYKTADKDAEWLLGIVEAKVEGGDKLTDAIEELKGYLSLLEEKYDERVAAFKYLAKKLHDIDLSDTVRFGQCDILGPSKWWESNQANWKEEKEKITSSFPNLNIRALTVNDDYLDSNNITISMLL